MFKHTLLLISVVILTILSSCQSSEGTIKVSLNDEFSLAIGQTAELQEEQLTIKFEGIQEDSRCPRGATCIWQGRVSCVLQVSDSSDSTKIVLTEPGLSDQYGKIIYKKYEFTSHVQPYPELGKKISSEEYRVLLTIKKTPFGSD
jgi:hypothetical protein